MNKKIVCILLAICMALTLLPAIALASDIPVSKVEVTVTAPVAGEKASYEAQVSGENAGDFTVSVGWDGGFDGTSIFQAGQGYTAFVTLAIKGGTGHSFAADNIDAKINGKTAKVESRTNTRLQISYTWFLEVSGSAGGKAPDGSMDLAPLRPYMPYGNLPDVKVEQRFSTHEPSQDYIKAPERFQQKKRPAELPRVARGILHIGDQGKQGVVTGYFTPSTSGYYRGYLLNEITDEGVLRQPLSVQTGPGNPNTNYALEPYTDSEYDVVAYDDNWVAVWDTGLWNDNAFGGGTCSRLFLAGYYPHGVYFFPRKNVYILDDENLLSKKPTNTAQGTATALLAIKTAPKSKDYIKAGVFKANQTFQVIDPTPIDGHYKIYHRGGAYYVNAEYVNLKQRNVTKPVITYLAKVDDGKYDYINIRSQPSSDAPVMGKAKTGTAIEIIELEAGGGFSKIWFNSQECYIAAEYLKSRRPTANTLGAPIGRIVVDTAYKAYGAAVWDSIEPDERGKRSESGHITAKLQPDQSAPVYEVFTSTYLKKYASGGQENITETFYKVMVDERVGWVAKASPFTYYPGESLSYSVTSNIQRIYVDGKKYDVVAYNIGGNNYFKIRDIAQMVSGTPKAVDVEWDAGTNAINLLSLADYTSVGGELAKGDGSQKTAAASQSILTLDGLPVGASCYTVEGNNYFKLRDVTDALDCWVEWDQKANAIKIATNLPAKEDPNEIKG